MDAIPDNTIYHYCGIDSFKAILESKSIRLGNMNYMNDYIEHNWLKRIAIRHIRELKENEPNRFYDVLETAVRFHERDSGNQVPYCACFSADWDSLGQWRAYADDGRGFAIGFNTRYFNLPAWEPAVAFGSEPPLGIARVNYERNEQQREVKDLIAHYREKKHVTHDTDLSRHDSTELGLYATLCYVSILTHSITCKNPKFKEEHEWRIIHTPTLVSSRNSIRTPNAISDIGFRARNGQIVPFFSLSFGEPKEDEPIARIVLGPQNPASQDPHSLMLFVRHCGLSIGPEQIRTSEASYHSGPYRPSDMKG